MQSKTFESLGINQVLSELVPLSSYGRALKKKHLAAGSHKLPFLREEYRRLESLLSFLRREMPKSLELKEYLHSLPELRIASAGGLVYQLHDLFEMKQFLFYYQKIRWFCLDNKLAYGSSLVDLEKYFALLDPEGQRLPLFNLSPLYDVALANALEEQKDLAIKLRTSRDKALERASRALGMNNLKPEFTLSKLQNDLYERVLASGFFALREDRATNAVFILIDDRESDKMKAQIFNIQSKIAAAESRILGRLSKKLNQIAPKLQKACAALARIDWDYTRACFALQYNCSLPVLHQKSSISITAARNLSFLNKPESEFQSLSFEIDKRINLLTGPNMGGKSTALKTLGQICNMAALAIPLPCESARLPIFDFVWYNQQAQSDENLSSFGLECVHLEQILKKRGRGLILLDEFGKSTNPAEGEALALAVLKYLNTTAHLCFAATHFTAPASLKGAAQFATRGVDLDLLEKIDAARNPDLKERLALISQAMDYRLLRLSGKQNPPLCAIRIAKALGLRSEILEHLK
ncbi:MAG: hypothetical protein PHI68_02545 [Candidatus Cloacimonetes bacterium]|nr:hypothetical protein [Candidatus Cloacimonadota bacterium]